jgi:RecA/RadA recombinase
MHDNMALARATSATFPMLAKFAEATNTCIIFLNQVRTDPNKKVMPGRPNTPDKSPGGGAPEFYATQRLRLGRTFITDEKQGFKKVGQTINCEVFKNKVWRPFEKCEWDFMFQADGTGRFDVISGVIDELKALSILASAGAYITWLDGKKYYRSELVKKIEAEGLQDELIALLPNDA